MRKDGTHFWALVVIDRHPRAERRTLSATPKITRDLTERESRRGPNFAQSEEQFRLLVQGVPTTRSTCSSRKVTWQAGTPVRSTSRDMPPRDYRAGTSRNSTRRKPPCRTSRKKRIGLETCNPKRPLGARRWRSAKGRHCVLGTRHDRRHPRRTPASSAATPR